MENSGENSGSLYKKYLGLIGIKTVPTGIDGLREIVRKHLYHVPFENISKLLLLGREKTGRPLSLPEFLDGIEFHDLGGTCHSSNPYLQELLTSLGFDTVLLGADMDRPNVHTCLRATVDAHQYHIDVGYAAPFRSPMRLDKTPHTIRHGKYTYWLKKNETSGKYEIEVLLDTNRIHGYTVNDDVRQFDFFKKTIEDSFKTGQTFMSCVRITRVFEDQTIEMKDNRLIHYKGGNSHSKILKNMDAVESAVKNELRMPRCPIKKAIGILEQVTQQSFFKEKTYPEPY